MLVFDNQLSQEGEVWQISPFGGVSAPTMAGWTLALPSEPSRTPQLGFSTRAGGHLENVREGKEGGREGRTDTPTASQRSTQLHNLSHNHRLKHTKHQVLTQPHVSLDNIAKTR